MLLWLQIERGGRNLIDFKLEDALSWRTFLTVIPDRWISRVKAAPGTAGWFPFKGQISAASQAQVMTIVGAWFDWLEKKAGQGRAADTRALDPKATTDRAAHEIKAFIERLEASATRARARFILTFYRVRDYAMPSCSPPRLPSLDECILGIKCPIGAMDSVQLSAAESSRSGEDSAAHGNSRGKWPKKKGCFTVKHPSFDPPCRASRPSDSR